MSSVRGPTIFGKRSRRRVDDRGRFIDGERRLGDVGHPLGILDLELLDVLLVLDEHDLLGRLAHRAFDLLVAGVADEHDRVAVLGEFDRLAVHLRDQRAGRVDRLQAAAARRPRARSARRRGRRTRTRRPRALRSPPRRRSRRAPRAPRRRACCGRSPCARRRARRAAPAPVRPSARPGRRPRSSRAAPPGSASRPCWPRGSLYWPPSAALLPRPSRQGTLSRHGPASPRSPDARRRVVPAPGGPELAHAHRRADARRGPAAEHGGVPRTDPPAPAPRPALPPQARLHGDRQRPPRVGRRPQLQPRVPRPPHRAAGAGHLRAAAGADRAHLLPAARPLQAAVGDVADRGSRGRPLRADHQDPPLADRRHRRRRPRDRAVRHLARPAADPELGPRLEAAPGAGRGAAPRRGPRRRRARRAWRSPRARSTRSRTRSGRWRASARPPRASARSSGRA